MQICGLKEIRILESKCIQDRAKNTVCPCMESYKIPDTLVRVAILMRNWNINQNPFQKY
jgi:hypothetical protein